MTEEKIDMTDTEENKKRAAIKRENKQCILLAVLATVIYACVLLFIFRDEPRRLLDVVGAVFWFFVPVNVFTMYIVQNRKKKADPIRRRTEIFFILPWLGILFVPWLDGWGKAVYVFFLIGYEFTGFGVGYLLQSKNRGKRCTVLTTASVTGNVREIMRGGTPAYCPILKYYAGNDWQEITCDDGFPHPFTVGTNISIYYNPSDPKEFQFQERKVSRAQIIGAWVFLAVGVILLAVSIYLCFVN